MSNTPRKLPSGCKNILSLQVIFSYLSLFKSFVNLILVIYSRRLDVMLVFPQIKRLRLYLSISLLVLIYYSILLEKCPRILLPASSGFPSLPFFFLIPQVNILYITLPFSPRDSDSTNFESAFLFLNRNVEDIIPFSYLDSVPDLSASASSFLILLW